MMHPSSATPVPDTREIILSASDVAVQFGGLMAVDGVSLEVRRGEIVGVIGPNGAGKTTFFQALSGFVRPTAGEVRFRGERIDGLAPELICRRGLTRTFQIVEVFPSLSVRETLTAAALVRMPLAEARKCAVATAGLVQLKDKLDLDLPAVDAAGPEGARDRQGGRDPAGDDPARRGHGRPPPVRD